MAVTARGVNAHLYVALTMAASPKTISAFTLSSTPATPNALVSSTAHGFTAGTIGVISSPGTRYHGQAIRAMAPTADAFTAQGFDNSTHGAWESGTITAAATWGKLSESIGFEVSGGDAKNLDDTRLMDVVDRNVVVGMAAQTIALTTRGQNYNSDVANVIRNAALNGREVLWKLELMQANGPAVWFWNGVPSLSTFGLQVGALGTGGFSVTPTGDILNGSLT